MMPDPYGRALVLIGGGLNGLVLLGSVIALAQTTDVFMGSFRDAQVVMRRKPPRVLCVIEEQLTEEGWETVARWSREAASRVLVLVERAPELRYPALIVIRSATDELGPHARAVIAEPHNLVALRDFCREIGRS
jgi:hypothetical protein